MEESRPRVGIGLFIFKDGKVLLGKRKGKHAPGVYAGPGGHLESMEAFVTCAKREAMEEAGIEIDNIKFLCITNFQEYAPRHYVDIGLIAEWRRGEPKALELDKCEGWDWYDIEKTPEPLFGVVKNYLEAVKTGRNYFDS